MRENYILQVKAIIGNLEISHGTLILPFFIENEDLYFSDCI